MSTTARVPIMVTQAMKVRLRPLGLADGEIDALSPAEAWERLGGMPEPEAVPESPAEPEPTADELPPEPAQPSSAGGRRPGRKRSRAPATHDVESFPHNTAAEEKLIGAVLIDPGLRDDLRELVDPGDFYVPELGAIYGWMVSADDLPDEEALRVYLSENPAAVELVGGMSNIARLIAIGAGEPMGLALAAPHARMVHNLAVRRRGMEAGAAAVAALHEGRLEHAARHAARIGDLVASATGKGWRWRSLAQAMEPKPPRAWVVGKLLPVYGLAMVYGSPGDLKSMLLADCALCVAAGRPWLAGMNDDPAVQSWPVLRGPVLWLDADNGADRTERRLAALAGGHGIGRDAPLELVSFPSPAFVASEPASVALVVRAVRDRGARLVVVDNLAAVSGGADENSAEMMSVMGGLRRIAEEAACGVFVIHHSTKNIPVGRAGNALRGFSGIEGALDLALQSSREPGSDVITLRSTKTRDVPVSPFSALFTWEHDATDELRWARFYGLGKPETESLSKQEQAELCILAELPAGVEKNQSAIVEIVKREAGIGKNTAIAAAEALVQRGELERRGGGSNNESVYCRRR